MSAATDVIWAGIMPGEPFTVPSTAHLPNLDEIEPYLLVEAADKTGQWLATWPMSPTELIADHPAYGGGKQVNPIGSRFEGSEIDGDGGSQYRRLGFYRIASRNGDWASGTTTFEPFDPFAPIWDESDPRWADLAAYLEEKNAIPGFWPHGEDEAMSNLTRAERGGWYAHQVLGLRWVNWYFTYDEPGADLYDGDEEVILGNVTTPTGASVGIEYLYRAHDGSRTLFVGVQPARDPWEIPADDIDQVIASIEAYTAEVIATIRKGHAAGFPGPKAAL